LHLKAVLCKVQSVDHPCYRCNGSVEEGIPFCPHCGAPQIRVVVEEGDEPVTNAMPPGTPGELPPPAQPVYPSHPAWPPALNPDQINWRVARPPAALAGILAGILMQLPYFTLLSLVWLFAAGAYSATAYRKRTGAHVGAKMGAKLGALSGFFTFIIVAIANTLKFVLFPNIVRDQLKVAMDSSLKNADPQSAKLLEGLFQSFQTQAGMAVLLALSLGVALVLLLIVTSAGGAAWATFSKKSQV
jgi:hypothetical protein